VARNPRGIMEDRLETRPCFLAHFRSVPIFARNPPRHRPEGVRLGHRICRRGSRIVIVPILLTVSLPDPHLSIVPICCAPATHSVAWPLSRSRRRVRSGVKLPNDL